ncbi:MAG: hypothetical protein KDA41_14350, partial [Planctomycetales bacterium]|nr:hypothetical protein [Planctomycetales bacterium]
RIEAVEERTGWRFGDGGSLQFSSSRVVAIGHNTAVPTTRSSSKARAQCGDECPTTAATNRSARCWLPADGATGVALDDVLCHRRAPTSLGKWRATTSTARRGSVKSIDIGNDSSSSLFVGSRRGALVRVLALHCFVGVDIGMQRCLCMVLLFTFMLITLGYRRNCDCGCSVRQLRLDANRPLGHMVEPLQDQWRKLSTSDPRSIIRRRRRGAAQGR